MSIPRPKILTRLTVPSGGWVWDIDVSDVAQYDTPLTNTIPAGDYYIGADNQSDDLLYVLQSQINTAAQAALVASAYICIGIDPDTHKVEIQFYGYFTDAAGDNDVRLNLTSWTAGLCAALGFDGSADVASTATDNPTFTADWHHAYGWYADEDGQGDIRPVDRSMAFTIQGKGISGKVKTQFFGESFASELRLQFLERYEQGRTKVFSDGIGYGVAPTHPYNRNEPLECWWEEARKGVEFRVYPSARLAASVAAGTGVSTNTAATTITDASKSWATDPQQWKGGLFGSFAYSYVVPQWFYITSHTATVITVPNAHPTGLAPDSNVIGVAGITYYLYDYTYKTYVLDTKEMDEFDPRERRDNDRWYIAIPLLRFVA